MSSSGSPKVGDKVWRVFGGRWNGRKHEVVISKVHDNGLVDLEWVTTDDCDFPGMHLSSEGVKWWPAGSEPGNTLEIWAEEK